VGDIEATVRPAIAIVLEHAGNNWGAYAPAVPGCVATGPTAEACRQSMEEALELHFELLTEQGKPIIAALAAEFVAESEAAAHAHS
jgi:predicted RNase H-like HicB family nuclease